jgi:hypothetical protein
MIPEYSNAPTIRWAPWRTTSGKAISPKITYSSKCLSNRWPGSTKDRTFNTVSQRILPGRTGRVATGRPPLGREEVVWVRAGRWPGGCWGDAEEAVLIGRTRVTGAGQVALIGRTVLRRRLPAHPLVEL